MKNYQGVKIIQEIKSLFHGENCNVFGSFLIHTLDIISKDSTLHVYCE